MAADVDAFLDQIKDMDVGRQVALYKRRFGVPESVLNDDNAESVLDGARAHTGLVRRRLHVAQAVALNLRQLSLDEKLVLLSEDGPVLVKRRVREHRGQKGADEEDLAAPHARSGRARV